jgi:hypothetical protein
MPMRVHAANGMLTAVLAVAAAGAIVALAADSGAAPGPAAQDDSKPLQVNR